MSDFIDNTDDDAALIVMPTINLPSPTDIQENMKEALSGIYKKLEDEISKVPADVSTQAGRDAIRTLAYKIARTKTKLDESATNLTKDQKALIDAVNEERRTLKSTLDEMKVRARKPLTDWEDAEKLREAKVVSEFKYVREYAAGSYDGVPYVDLPAEKLDSLADAIAFKRPCDVAVFGEASENFNALVLDAETAIRERAMKVRQDEKDRAELAKMREERERQEAERQEREAAEREAQRERERAAEAARVAQRAAQDKIDEEARRAAEAERRAAEAEAARIAAEEQRERDAKIAEERRVQAEKDAAEQRERDRLAAAEAEKQRAAQAKREADEARERAVHEERQKARAAELAEKAAADARAADLEHRRKINAAALKALVAASDVDEATAKIIIEAVAKFQIPHMKIEY